MEINLNSLKLKLLYLEKNFEQLKTRTEKYHTLFIIIYFLPPLIAALIFTKYFKEFFSLYIKIIIYAVVLSGVCIHYFLRYKFHKSKNRYKAFIENGLDPIRNENTPDFDFKNAVIESVREIFKERSIPFSNISIRRYPFWELVFINLGIEIPDDN
jgi:ABC-type polysaccharide transport system permease subunit